MPANLLPQISEQHPDVGNLFVFHMAGIAALTLLVNASTTGLLVEKLGVANVSVASKQIFHNAVRAVPPRIGGGGFAATSAL